MFGTNFKNDSLKASAEGALLNFPLGNAFAICFKTGLL